MHEDDKQKTRAAMAANIYGYDVGKKRKRNQVEGLDDVPENDFEKRKLERMRERNDQLDSQEDEQLEQHLLEGGKGRAQEHLKMKMLIDEEDLSENEIKDQIENQKYFTYLRKQTLKEQLKKMDKNEKEMEEELGGLLIQEGKKLSEPQTTASESPSKKTSKEQPKPATKIRNRFLGALPLGQKKVHAMQTEDKKKRSDIGPVATGMQKFMKQDSGDFRAKKAGGMNMFFRQRKAI